MAVRFASCRWRCRGGFTRPLLLAVLCLLPLACNRAGSSARTVHVLPPLTASDNIATSGSPRQAESDWPSFLGPLGTGASPETGILTRWPKGGLRVRWQVPLGGGYGPPAVTDGRVFLAERRGDQGRVTCLDAATGAELWHFGYPTEYRDHFGYDGGPRSGPVVDGDRVYAYGAEGMLHCLRVADGSLLWKVNTEAEYNVVQNFFGVAAAPKVEGDLLLVPVGGSPKDADPGEFRLIKGNGSGLVAFDKRTGQERYRITDELASYSSPVVADIDGRRWGFYWARKHLVGFELATGKVEFQFPWRARALESVNAANPVVVGDRVLLTECYGQGSVLLRVQPGGCDVLWQDDPEERRKRLECHWNTPIHVDGFVYGSSGRNADASELRCVELATGLVAWRHPEFSRASLLLVDGHFVVLTESGQLLLVKVNPQRYDEVARMELSQGGAQRFHFPFWAAPVLARGWLYIRGEQRLTCLELIPQR
jgi:outer membrane protein assembly factor BamB